VGDEPNLPQAKLVRAMTSARPSPIDLFSFISSPNFLPN
jgi:hypothetical protein